MVATVADEQLNVAKPNQSSNQLESAKRKVSVTEVKEARQRREDAEKMLRGAKAALSEKQSEKVVIQVQGIQWSIFYAVCSWTLRDKSMSSKKH